MEPLEHCRLIPLLILTGSGMSVTTEPHWPLEALCVVPLLGQDMEAVKVPLILDPGAEGAMQPAVPHPPQQQNRERWSLFHGLILLSIIIIELFDQLYLCCKL